MLEFLVGVTAFALPPVFEFLKNVRDFQVVSLAQAYIVVEEQVEPGILQASLTLLFLPELGPFCSRARFRSPNSFQYVS
jgi:hypothetical protein